MHNAARSTSSYDQNKDGRGDPPGHPSSVLVSADQPPMRVTVQITPDSGTV
jgi:hypothetical protein